MRISTLLFLAVEVTTKTHSFPYSRATPPLRTTHHRALQNNDVGHPEDGERDISVRVKLASDLSMTERQMKQIEKVCPENVWERLTISRWDAFLDLFRSELGLTDAQVSKALVGRPALLCYNVQNLSEKAHYFRHTLGLSQEDVIRMVNRSPQILTYNIQTRLNPTVVFLRDNLKMKKRWRWIISRYPQVFSCSVENSLRPRCDFLRSNLHLQRSSDLSQIIGSFPPALWLTDDTLMTKLDFLSEELKFDEHDLRDVLVTYPQLLGLSVDRNLRPKLAFFVETCGMTPEQVKEFVLYQPPLLAYSLEGRIRPRVEEMAEISIEFAYAPPYLMSLTESKFKKWVAYQKVFWTSAS